MTRFRPVSMRFRPVSMIVTAFALLVGLLVLSLYFLAMAPSRPMPARHSAPIVDTKRAMVALQVPGDFEQPSPAPVSPAATGEGDDPIDRMEWRKSDTLFPNFSAPEWVRKGPGSRVSKSRSEVLGRIAVKPSKKDEIAGYSSLEPTLEEAFRSARLSLQRQLEDTLLYELIKDGDRHGARSPDGEALIRQSAASLVESGSSGREEFHESAILPTSGQTIHRAAIFVRIPDGWDDKQERAIGLRLDEIREAAGESRRTQMGTAGSILLLAFVVLLLYLFLNAGTKGYFAWPLRIISAVLYALVCLGLLYARGHFQ